MIIATGNIKITQNKSLQTIQGAGTYIPFTTIVLTQYGHHALDRAKDGTMNDDRTLLFTALISTAATYNAQRF